MIPPQEQQDETAVSSPNHERTVLYLFIGLVVTLTLAFILSRILLKDHNDSLLLGIVTPVLIIATLLGAGLMWRGKVMVGTGLLILALFAAAGYGISQRANMGIFLAISVALISTLLIGYSWPLRWRFAGLSALVGAGIVLSLADLFWPGSRPLAPLIVQTILYTITGLLVALASIWAVRQFNNFTLRTKLVGTFLMVAIVPLTIITMLHQQDTQTVLTNNANKSLSTAASQTAATIDDFLAGTLNDVRVEAGIMGQSYDWAYYRRLKIEERHVLGILGEERAIELLKIFRDKAPLTIISYALLDMEGQVLFEYPPSDRDPDESDSSYFLTLIETGQAAVSSVEFLPESGEAYIAFSDLVFDDAGKRFGVLRVQYKAAVLQSLITRSTGMVGGQSFAVLFDENHLHLAHGLAPDTLYKLTALPSEDKIAALQADRRLPDRPLDELSTNLPELDASLNNAQEQPLFMAADVATGDRIDQAAVAIMSEQPWQVVFFQPQDVFLAPIKTQTRRATLVVLAVAGIVTAVAVAVSNFIAQPILRLDALAARAAQGDLSVQVPVESNDEVGTLARTFNLMTTQLRDLVGNLEQRVADRTQEIEISGEVSQRLSTILDRQELVKAVVDQVQQAFNYYHAHIYLFDKAGEYLIMVGGTGEAGQIMLERGHKIPQSKGLVGRAGKTNRVILAPDVRREPGWLPNDLLPDTKAEIAVPIVSGDQVFGVLDVQHNVTEGLTQSDASLLQIIASQVAVALQNAQLYARMQQLALREAQINAIGQKIQNTTSVENAMETAVRELGRILKSDQTSVRLNTGMPGSGLLRGGNNGHDSKHTEIADLENLS